MHLNFVLPELWTQQLDQNKHVTLMWLAALSTVISAVNLQCSSLAKVLEKVDFSVL